MRSNVLERMCEAGGIVKNRIALLRYGLVRFGAETELQRSYCFGTAKRWFEMIRTCRVQKCFGLDMQRAQCKGKVLFGETEQRKRQLS